jgi:hypothetical protein
MNQKLIITGRIRARLGDRIINISDDRLTCVFGFVFKQKLEGHCATSQKVAGSIPDVVIEIFH